MKTRILFLYFSGTGNTLFAINELKQYLDADITIHPLRNIPSLEGEIKKNDIIGIFYPTYYTHAPNIVTDILKNYHDFFEAKRLILLNTFSGNPGYAIHDIFTIFNRNTDIQHFSIRMPGNYYAEYGAFPKWYQDFLITKASSKIKNISEDIRANTPSIFPIPNKLARLSNNQAVKKLKTFSVLDEKFYTTNACTHCSICKKVCPVQNIIIDKKQVIWKNECEQCMACLQWCPQHAIQIEHVSHKRKRYKNHSLSVGDIIKLNK